MIEVAQRFAAGSLGLAAVDFERNGYTADWALGDATTLHTSTELQSAWDDRGRTTRRSRRAGRRSASFPRGTLGRRVLELYQARGFEFPGGPVPRRRSSRSTTGCTCWRTSARRSSPSSRCSRSSRAPTTTCAASRSSRWSSRCSRPAICAPARDCSSTTPVTCRPARGMAVRVADAMRRGRAVPQPGRPATRASTTCRSTGSSSRRSRSTRRASASASSAKSDGAIAAGSVGPCEPGGISPFQLRAGRALAEREGREYDAYGAGR